MKLGGINAESRVSDKHRRIVIAIILAAFLLAFSTAVLHRADTAAKLISDDGDYYHIAKTMLSDHKYLGTYRPPAYPTFLALVFAVAGFNLFAVYAAQALLFALTLWIVYKIVSHICDDSRIAIGTIAICALWLPFYSSVTEVLTENVSGFIIALALYLVLLAIDRPKPLICILAGILLGFATLAKSPFLLFLPIPPLFVLFSGKKRLYGFLMATLMVVGIVCIVAPWTIRNRNVTGEIVPVCTGGGVNFWLGNWPDYDQKGLSRYDMPKDIAAQINGKSEPEIDRILMNIGKSYIKENPKRAVGIFARKFSKLWFGALGQSRTAMSENVPHVGNFSIPKMALLNVPFTIAAIFGWFLLPLKSKKKGYPILAALVVWTVAYVVFTAERRYSIPLDFYRAFFAAVTINWLISRNRKSKSETCVCGCAHEAATVE